MPSVMTIAVSTMACGKGSLISSIGVEPTIGAPPAAPPATRKERFTPLPTRMMPITTRLRLRSSRRYTPVVTSTAMTTTSRRFGLIP